MANSADKKADGNGNLVEHASDEGGSLSEDHVMSVDGDVSYNSAEMEESGNKTSPYLKLKEANVSHHMIDKQGSLIKKRIFLEEVEMVSF